MKLSARIVSLLGIFLLLASLSQNADAKHVQRPSKLSPDDIEHALASSRSEPPSGRSVFELQPRDLQAHNEECRNVHSVHDKCAFIRKHCRDERVGFVDYLELYYCRLGHSRGTAFVVLALWLTMLFSTIGIAASDFFCVNLSTIASILGMSESMAGVTFLAFGNGSPDVFSTFAAMKIDSGSLAVGELIGAACFITAVVAGSMAIVRPFKVGRKSFVRDVSFFAVAVLFGLFFLADGRIKMWECVAMIVFYLLYVVFVLGWHWMAGRRKDWRRKERHAREHYTAPEEEQLLVEEEEEDDEDGGVGGSGEDGGLGAGLPDFEALERGVGRDDEDDDEDEQEQREYAELSNNMRITRPAADRRSTSAAPHSIRPSLVGALEFRAVLNSLEKTKNLQGRQIHLRRYSDEPLISAQVLSEPALPGPAADDRHTPQSLLRPTAGVRHTPQSLLRPPAGPAGRIRAVSMGDAVATSANGDHHHHHHHHHHHYQVPDLLEPADSEEEERQAPQDGHLLLAHMRGGPPRLLAPPPSNGTSPSHSPTRSAPVSPLSKAAPRLPVSDDDSTRSLVLAETPERAPSPSAIWLPRPSMDSSVTIASGSGHQWEKFRYWPYHCAPPPQHLYATFFPTLRGFWDKTFFEKLFALAAVPSVLLLTLTLPVVEGADSAPHDHHLHPHGQQRANPDSPTSFASSTTAATPMMPPSNALSQPTKDWNRWLVAVQCITAPLFIALVLFADSTTPLLKPVLYALLVGLVCLALLLALTSPSEPPRLRYLLCFAGFVVAISWISTIAEEVVGILKAFGVIFGISDAILGLTIFAVGNSLGDLVADITVARLGFPVMALSACFGGPMLNILLGIGIGGLYTTLSKGQTVYRIEVSSTLIISAATLLLTLVVLLVWVPLNGWMMSRRIGWTLIVIWLLSTVANVVVEVTGVGRRWGGQVAGSG